MRLGWVLFIARRYFRTKRKNRGLAPSMLSVAGIAVGVMTLISVLGVMNGFQLGFINDILAISSYHLRIQSPKGPLDSAQLERLRSLPGIAAVLPFRDVQTMVSSGGSGFQASVIRGVPANAMSLDPDLASHLNIVSGSFDVRNNRSIVMGYALAQTLGAQVGDSISIVSLAGGSFLGLRPESLTFTVTGLFKSGYYEFDQSLCFVTLQAAASLGSSSEDLI
ncbi:MAG TPA: ABC transporter permease [Spirochaetia bacterium]|nr:ABC transporter permease [Spirochaetia bacterium]